MSKFFIEANKADVFSRFTCNSLIMRFRLLPCRTTWAWEIRSSGTKGAGTETMGLELLLLPLPPIITPGAPPILPLLAPLPPPRMAELLRIIRARDLDIPALLPLPLLPLPLGVEFELPTWLLLMLEKWVF